MFCNTLLLTKSPNRVAAQQDLVFACRSILTFRPHSWRQLLHVCVERARDIWTHKGMCVAAVGGRLLRSCLLHSCQVGDVGTVCRGAMWAFSPLRKPHLRHVLQLPWPRLHVGVSCPVSKLVYHPGLCAPLLRVASDHHGCPFCSCTRASL